METITLVNKGKRHSRSRMSLTSPSSIWRSGTKDMSYETLAGGIAAGWAATGIPAMVGAKDGWLGLAAAGATAVVGTVLIGKYISGKAALGFGIVGATIVVNRLVKAALGIGVPYLSGTLSNAGFGQVSDFLGRLGQTDTELFGQTEEELFGVETYGYGQALEPTYMGWGTHVN